MGDTKKVSIPSRKHRVLAQSPVRRRAGWRESKGINRRSGPADPAEASQASGRQGLEMSSSIFRPTSRARYRAHLLGEPQLSPWGVAYLEGARCALLLWNEVEHAMAAEVGEPQGVRAIVFDLLTSEDDGWLAHRFAAEPGDEAMEAALAISEGLGPEAADTSIKSVATGGIPTRWYPDLESFEEESLHLLDGKGRA
jgi:hypothetical protein